MRKKPRDGWHVFRVNPSMKLNRIAMLSATLLGLAVAVSAQRGVQDRRANGPGAGARKYVKPTQRTARGSTRVVRRVGSRNAPVRRAPVRRAPRAVYAAPRFRVERIWVPGPIRRVYVPPRYEYRFDFFRWRRVRICVSEGYYETVRDPGHWEQRRVRVGGRYRPGYRY